MCGCGVAQVRGIETLTTYDPSTQEFIIDTPCESAQKYWIGGAAKVTRLDQHLFSMDHALLVELVREFKLAICA